MNRLLHISATAGIAVITSGMMACGKIVASPPTMPAPDSVPIPPTEPTATAGWADILGTTPAPEGWQVAPCDAPILLCITADGEFAGTVERFSYPLSDINLAAPVEPVSGAEIEFLQAWVAEHYAAIQQDRQTADSSLVFTTEPPTEISVGGLPGLRYSFAATHLNGTLADRYVGYVTTDGERLHVFVTGVIRGDYGGVFGDSAVLTEFEPYLDEIIRGLSLSQANEVMRINPHWIAITE